MANLLDIPEDELASGLLGVGQLDYSGQYNTPLTPIGEKLFQQQTGGNEDTRDYDLRGAWAQMGGGEFPEGHLRDTFKKPNHPTFSTGSIYAGDGNEAGVWTQLPSQLDDAGTWTFLPGRTNRDIYGTDNLGRYFRRVEPGNFLLSAKGGQ